VAVFISEIFIYSLSRKVRYRHT